ncbi:hypothetical protein ACMSDU_22420 [Bacteroides thetaiotaomicron]|uniref:hypothetical protein n=1 Tax=Bacteroides thetaiotaomicron TaxID=818 RepID=UPI0039C2818E
MNKYELFMPIGETLELDNGKTITCVEDEPCNIYEGCTECVFHKEGHPENLGIHCFEMCCNRENREDRNDVHFEYIK